MAEKKSAVEETPAVGFELEPEEIAVHLKIHGATVTHVFSRLMNRGERINCAVAESKQELKGDEIIIGSDDVDTAYSNAWKNMIKDISGYTGHGKPLSLEEARDKIYTQHKKAAVKATNNVVVIRPGETLGEETLDIFEMDTVVELDANQGGRSYTIQFSLKRPLSDKELHALQREGSRFKTGHRGGVIIGSPKVLHKIEEIFDGIISSVSGYLVKGKPLTPKTANWLRNIPIDHKAMVIGELRRRITAEEADPN